MPLLFLIFLLHSPLLAVGAAGVPPAPSAPYFVANEGQWPGNFQFKCEVGSTIYYVTPKGMTIDFRSYVGADGNPPALSRFDNLAERGFVGAAGVPPAVPRRNLEIKGHVLQIHYVLAPQETTRSSLQARHSAHGANKLPHYSNYFLGRDSTKWRSRVSHYENVIVPEVWPGIDVEYRADKQGIETIYHVKPGADPAQIQMEYLGLDAPLRVDAQGNLILSTSLGDVKEKVPFAFQQESRTQKRVDAVFRVIDETRVRYDVGAFDAGKELVVDPLIYSTFLGGDDAADRIERFLELASGEFLVSGETGSNDFPSTPGTYQEFMQGSDNAFVTKLSENATDILFSTFYGATGTVSASDVEVMPDGDIVIIGTTSSGTIPLTPDALDSTQNGFEGFVALMTGDGTDLLYSSYLGELGNDYISDCVIDSAGRVIITGSTTSVGFPTTPDALFSELTDGGNAFLAVIDVYAPSLVFSSFFGGGSCEGYELKLANDNTLWLVGETLSPSLAVTEDAYQSEHSNPNSGDAFLSHVQLDPPANLYTSYLGGDGHDRVTSFELVDNVVVLFGYTYSSSWPTTPGVFDSISDGSSNGFVTIFQPPDSIIMSTLLGDFDTQIIEAGTVSPDGAYVVAGFTTNDEFPITTNALDSTFGPNIGEAPRDLFITKFAPDLATLEFSTFFGGNDIEHVQCLWVPTPTTLWVLGTTESSADFPTTPDAFRPQKPRFDSDGFISRIEIEPMAARNPVPIAHDFTLSAYPNPFNPTTTLSFTLPHRTSVTLKIHDILGREVERVELGNMTAGQHELKVNGEAWSSGIYFATLATPTFTQTQKLLLLR